MSSTSHSKKQWDPRWDGLPRKIRLLITQYLIQDGCPLAPLATVSREMQTDIERHNFAWIRLTPSRLASFRAMIQRTRGLVGYIWFCLELDDTSDEFTEGCEISGTDKCPITASFQDLFSVLGEWEPHGDLTLDISLYSTSDSDIVGHAIEKASRKYHDPKHGWLNGSRHLASPPWALRKLFHLIMEQGPHDSDQGELDWWDQLPSVPAVTSLLLRQQNRRRWKPVSLAHMFAQFPRLQELHYEPWREWEDWTQDPTDREYKHLFESIQRSNKSLRKLYPANMRPYGNYGGFLAGTHAFREPVRAVGQMIALASLKLEHLAASYITDTSHFFEIRSEWAWPNLKSLTLTAKILTPDKVDSTGIGALLLAAAAAAEKMPRLETMDIWNGRKGLAALFRYQVFRNEGEAVLTWRGTLDLAMEPAVIQAWQVVTKQYDISRLDVVVERLYGAIIRSHGDAIQHLGLSSQVIRPVSLQQIRINQKALEGVATVES
ncbi:hypothetical protein BDP81DRAFT_456634 [Colletotrichum phormii]|uniref:DUF6546 domain-containing protein n=1 Tax=Colletotrichum phormii TaxID=359342 RepID=A0AAJ0A762_9PEZI|nr:uncharacterized protein BDP81DRAFT_456634 [Colletotrichum phormii]KAK1655795.1 hypothetical protein BDP81DRAFT_456634 [Colletotrichum phormii]